MKERNSKITPVITVRAAKEKVFFGPGVQLILEVLAQTGSMKEACARTGISYSKAWKILNTAEAQLGYSLVLRSHGGANKGGCLITEEGQRILAAYLQAHERICRYSEEVFEEVFNEF